ncbi:MAG: TetR/AcrR family transcriptional regulator [Zoogloea sp.]|nr:TetR/AcrR family transcriptional regulator [Zoogloea sp.]
MTEHAPTPRSLRRQAVSDLKRQMILDAAERIFQQEGLDGAHMRAIAREAGYTVSALYKYYPSKEEIYADLLAASLDRLHAAVEGATPADAEPALRLRSRARGFFGFYLAHPRELDLGFYLFHGLQPLGLNPELDATLNRRLADSLTGMQADMQALGLPEADALRETTALFAHATGVLLLVHTGRIRMFGQQGPALFEAYLDSLVARIEARQTQP